LIFWEQTQKWEICDDCTFGEIGITRMMQGYIEDIIYENAIGKTVFTTREEAEAALKAKPSP
jgi:hypothetical protein